MLRHSGGLSGQRVGLHYILMGCWLTLLFFASPSFAQPAASLSQSPQAASAAQSIQLQGTLEVLHEDDFKNKKSRTRHFLKTEAGERYELKFKGKVPQHSTGTKLRVKGAKSGNILYLDTSGTTTTSTVTVTQVIAPNTFGPQNTLVILVNFQDQPANQPWTADQVKSFVFGTVSNFFQENSYGQTTLTGDVSGWYTVPVNSTSCDDMALETYAKQAAAAAGVNLSVYTRFVYLFPGTGACAYTGSSTVGGNPSRAWINGDLTTRVWAHELGHSLGLYHAHSWLCSDGNSIPSISDPSCIQADYGDGADIMGQAPSAHFNAFHKEHLGWLNYGMQPPITTVQTNGTYLIDPYETTGTGPKALKILKGIDPVTGKQVWYYVEYRQAIGFDANLANLTSQMDSNNVLNGVIVHMGSPDESNGTGFLLDMTPATYTMQTRDPALDVGLSFTDPAAGVTITTRWVNSTNAAVDVTIANSSSSSSSSTCTHAAPSVVVSTSQTASVAAGTAVSYTVAVTNNDSSACAASTFSLSSSLPSGWIGSLGSSALTISPGSAGSTALTVTSATTALAGSYSVGSTATNSSSTSYSGSGSATYSVASTSTSTTTTTTKGKGKKL